MKKMVCSIFILLLSVVGHVNAKPFPTLKSYVVNGVVITDGLSNQEIFKRLGKPTRIKEIKNECAEANYTYYYYPNLTLIDRGLGLQLDEILVNTAKNQLHLSSLIVHAKTKLDAIKKLGVLNESTEKGIKTYRLEDPNDPSAWTFDFKADNLYRVSYFLDDC